MITGKGYTNRGGREYNEDSGMLGIADDCCYAVIADGLGGHGNGDIASQTAVSTIKECMQNLPEQKELTKEEIETWFHKANRKIVEMQTAECKMKTTLAFLYVDEKAGKANLAHLGDSRIYHFEGGRYVFCTFDHSVSRMAVLAGEIAWDDIRFHVDRNKLLKALGKAETVDAESEEIILDREKDHAFLLCTDGFWEYVTEEEMEKTLQMAESPADWLKRMRGYIEQRAGESNDNNSAIAIWVTKQR
ncbi:MAG: protein phosphatase 2C domain-containing protein [Ruminococcus sp.]|nr:protein phosphatase 2C domain-containing protein [Ruminococcus sp.]